MKMVIVVAWLQVIAPRRGVGAVGPAVCVGAGARTVNLPGRGPLARRCAAANVVSDRDEYLAGASKCAAASGGGGRCGCCRRRRVRRDARADAAAADAAARSRCARVAPPSTARVAVYTVVSGAYDLGLGATNGTVPEPGVDYYIFHDAGAPPRALPGKPWVPVALPPAWGGARPRNASAPSAGGCAGASIGGFATAAACASRDVKVRPQSFRALARYAASLYLDANVRIVGRVRDLLVAGGRAPRPPDLAVFTFKRSVDAEADWVADYLKRSLSLSAGDAAKLRRKVRRQAAAYGDLPATAYGKVLVRRHGSASCYFGERWWRELRAGVPRDQLSLLWAADVAGREVGLVLAALNAGVAGVKRCGCAADDAAFQARFRWLGTAGRGKPP